MERATQQRVYFHRLVTRGGHLLVIQNWSNDRYWRDLELFVFYALFLP